jgi:hypothetical protein
MTSPTQCYQPITLSCAFVMWSRGGNCHRRRGIMQNYCHLYAITHELDSLERSGTNHNTPIATYRIVYVWTNLRTLRFRLSRWVLVFACRRLRMKLHLHTSTIHQGWSRCWGRLRPSPAIYIHTYICILYLCINGMLTTPNEIKNIYEVKKCSYDISSKSYFRMFRCSLKKVCRISRNSKCTVIVL